MKYVSLLIRYIGWLPVCGLVADSAVQNNVTVKNEDNLVVKKYSDNLIWNNPFTPDRNAKLSSEDFNNSSDYELVSVVCYEDGSTVCSLKNKSSQKTFWLSSNPSNDDKDESLVFVHYSPINSTLTVKDVYTGECFQVKQNSINTLGNNLISNNSSSSRSFDFLEKSDDEDDLLPWPPKAKK